jgi:hypothetical protein
VNGDTPGGGITVTYSTTAKATSPARTYPISAAISGSAVGNYTPNIVNGTLTVTAQVAALDFTLTLTSAQSQTVIPGNDRALSDYPPFAIPAPIVSRSVTTATLPLRTLSRISTPSESFSWCGDLLGKVLWRTIGTERLKIHCRLAVYCLTLLWIWWLRPP